MFRHLRNWQGFNNMTKTEKERLKVIAFRYGKESQVDVAIEECSELIKALLKDRRKKANILEDIVDEIADVQIMLEQLQDLYDCKAEVDARITFKINRQLERMNLKGWEDGRS